MTLVHIAQNPLPAGAVVSLVKCAGVTLRVAHWIPSGVPRGTVAVLPGRSEFIEKYAEVVGELLRRGLAVAVLDWRGQGGSARLLSDPRRGHVRHFDEYRADLDAMAERVLTPFCPRPFFALAHSMGGAIVLDHADRNGGLFDRIVLSAPMFDIYGLRMPRATRAIAAAVRGFGGGGLYILGGSGRSWMTQPFEGNGLTSDRDRHAMFGVLARAAPHLVLGAPTFGWLHAAFKAMDRLMRPDALHRVVTPVLAVACGADRVVDTGATERLVGRLKTGRTIVVRHALHEILMETDTLRGQFWAAFDQFIPGSAR